MPQAPMVPKSVALDVRKSKQGFSPNGIATTDPLCCNERHNSRPGPHGGIETMAKPWLPRAERLIPPRVGATNRRASKASRPSQVRFAQHGCRSALAGARIPGSGG